jgi:hypothetical protein
MTGGLVLFYAGAVIQDANGFTFPLCDWYKPKNTFWWTENELKLLDLRKENAALVNTQ